MKRRGTSPVDAEFPVLEIDDVDRALAADTPVPEWLEFSTASCCGYPAWIGRNHVPSSVPA